MIDTPNWHASSSCKRPKNLSNKRYNMLLSVCVPRLVKRQVGNVFVAGKIIQCQDKAVIVNRSKNRWCSVRTRKLSSVCWMFFLELSQVTQILDYLLTSVTVWVCMNIWHKLHWCVCLRMHVWLFERSETVCECLLPLYELKWTSTLRARASLTLILFYLHIIFILTILYLFEK